MSAKTETSFPLSLTLASLTLVIAVIVIIYCCRCFPIVAVFLVSPNHIFYFAFHLPNFSRSILKQLFTNPENQGGSEEDHPGSNDEDSIDINVSKRSRVNTGGNLTAGQVTESSIL